MRLDLDDVPGRARRSATRQRPARAPLRPTPTQVLDLRGAARGQAAPRSTSIRTRRRVHVVRGEPLRRQPAQPGELACGDRLRGVPVSRSTGRVLTSTTTSSSPSQRDDVELAVPRRASCGRAPPSPRRPRCAAATSSPYRPTASFARIATTSGARRVPATGRGAGRGGARSVEERARPGLWTDDAAPRPVSGRGESRRQRAERRRRPAGRARPWPAPRR